MQFVELRKTECVLRGIQFPARHRQSAALAPSPVRTVGLSVPEMEKEWFPFPAESHPCPSPIHSSLITPQAPVLLQALN